MKSYRVQWNLRLEDAEAILQILKDNGHYYSHCIRHETYDNEDVTHRLKKLIRPVSLKRHEDYLKDRELTGAGGHNQT